jgi:hypothetical protein
MTHERALGDAATAVVDGSLRNGISGRHSAECRERDVAVVAPSVA